MKKVLSVLLAAVLTLSVFATTAFADEAKAVEPNGMKVTALFFSLEGEFFQMFDGLLREELESKGYEYESQSSNLDPITMCEQIENAAISGTDLIWTWAVSGEAIADTCHRVREDYGVKIYSFVQYPGEGNVDVFRGTDETECGHKIAEMAIDWADAKEYKEDGSIKALILGNEDSTQQKERFEAVQEKLAEDARFDILEAVTLEASTVAAQNTSENMFNKYDHIDCVITPAGEMALGVVAYTHSESSPVDFKDVAVFGTELNEEIANYIKDGSIIGTIMNGGVPAENVKTQAEQIDKLLKGEEVEAFSGVDLSKVTIDNLEEFGY